MSLHLPYRGDGSDRPVALDRMPLLMKGRPRKQWRYVGVFGERLMLCAGVVRIGPFPQTFWAVWDRDKQALRERTRFSRTVRLPNGRVLVEDGGTRIDLQVAPATAVETVSPAGSAWIWTRKQGAVRVTGTVTLDDEAIALDELGCVDESAGFHERLTEWEWSAGVGTLTDGRIVGWNLVSGVHDSETGSERTLWLDGVPQELPPVTFGKDLESVGGLRFTSEAVRERNDDLRVFKSDYVQPFGTFTGSFPGGLELAAGRGVMERHRALW